MDATTAAIIAGVFAAISPLVTLLIARRKLSGRIDTTEAGKLWDEAASLRADLTGQIKDCNERVDRANARADRFEENNRELRGEIGTLKQELQKANEQIAKLAEGR